LGSRVDRCQHGFVASVFIFSKDQPGWQCVSPPHPRSADENGITLENGEIKVEYAWGDFTQYKIFDAMALLYRGKRGMNIFTLGLFASPQEWQNFKDLVEARISKGIK